MVVTQITTWKHEDPNILIFKGENYDFLFVMMRIIFLSLDLWDLIENFYDDFDDMRITIRDQIIRLKEK